VSQVVSTFRFGDAIQQFSTGTPEPAAVRTFALLISHLNFENANSIGLRSGEYDGSWISGPAVAIAVGFLLGPAGFGLVASPLFSAHEATLLVQPKRRSLWA